MIKQYTCPWCSNSFEENVYYSESINPITKIPTKKSNFSTQVTCSNCARLIPTWKREETGSSTGRKHIHLRK